MATIRCPRCGDPVMIRGSRWECGYCGDFGDISSLFLSEQAKISHPTDEVLEKLERGSLSIFGGMLERFGEGKEIKTLAFQMTFYGMSHALIPAGNQTKRSLQLLRLFFRRYPFCTAEEVLGATRSRKPAFEEQFLLTKARLGSFWSGLLPKLPRYEKYKAWPNWLFDILDGLSEVESFFSHEDSSALLNTYQEVLETHWNSYHILHMNRAELEDMVRRWGFEENEWTCRDLLIADFPETIQRWTAEELSVTNPMEILLGVADHQPETAIRMMKLLLDTAEGHLQNEEVAQHLLGWNFHDLLVRDDMLPLLMEELKRDERLARQLFQSAYVGRPQEEILNACGRLGEKELQRKLLDLLDCNSFPHDEIELESDKK